MTRIITGTTPVSSGAETATTGQFDSGIAGTGRRAHYAMLSANSSNTWFGFTLYDQDFNPVLHAQYPGGRDSSTPGSIVEIADTTHMYGSQSFHQGSYSSSASTPSNNSTNTYINATPNSGQFGHTAIDVFSSGTFGLSGRKSNTWHAKYYLNVWAINSDHKDRRRVYALTSGQIRMYDLLVDSHDYYDSSASFSVSSLNSNMYGSASYNAVRKELTILSYQTSSGQYNVITYQGVDFDKHPRPVDALNQPDVVRVDSTVSMSSNWQQNDSESYYNLKPVVTDNGDVYVVVMFTHHSQRLYRFTRDGASAVNAAHITGQSLTTSYGVEQGHYYGQRQISSRTGNSVAIFCPYYYYGSGISCFMVNKRINNYTTFSRTTTGHGYHCVPYRDNGFAFYYCGNGYASNPNGSYIERGFDIDSSSSWRTVLQNKSFRLYTGPNTTNYPGFTQVTDYDLLTYNTTGPV